MEEEGQKINREEVAYQEVDKGQKDLEMNQEAQI